MEEAGWSGEKGTMEETIVSRDARNVGVQTHTC